MKFSLKKLFPFFYRIRFITQPEHEVELAFTSGGVEYFCFVNSLDAYYERYMAGNDAINALSMMVSRDYLKSHIALTKEYLNKGNLSAVAVLNANLEERMNHICNVDLLYQLASVWYFDKSENAYTYNPEYAEKKIKLWMKDKEVLAFFLRTPLKDFLPLSDTFTTSMLMTYTKAQRIELLTTLKNHLSKTLETPENNDLRSTIASQIAQLEELLTLAE